MSLPFVITGTIIPQSNFVHIRDWRTRREQYLESLLYFCRENKVFFLENSAYDIASDRQFAHENLTVVKIRDSDSPHEAGKGYQEFLMLDRFLSQEGAPKRFFKMSGRRTLKQVAAFQRRYAKPHMQWFDMWQNDRFCDTSFFCCDLDFYRKHLLGLYRHVNDGNGIIVEKVVYDALEHVSSVRFHPFTPIFSGQHGTSGNPLKGNLHIPTELRRICRAFLGKTKLDQRIFD